MPALTAERVREVLDYDPETGVFRRKTHRCRNHVDVIAGSYGQRRNGKTGISSLARIGVDGKLYRAHRIAWLYVYGEWPPMNIDHKDGDPFNNRIANLRLATKRQNSHNRRSMSACGLKGVSLDGRRDLWRARIKLDDKQKWLGYFRTKEEAAAAYADAARQYFGEFARVTDPQTAPHPSE